MCIIRGDIHAGGGAGPRLAEHETGRRITKWSVRRASGGRFSGHFARFSAKQLSGMAVAVDGGEWPAFGGEAANARYSPLAQITTANVMRLGGAWMSPKSEPAASTRALAVVRDGMIFVSLPPAVQAFNAKTGASVWRFQAG